MEFHQDFSQYNHDIYIKSNLSLMYSLIWRLALLHRELTYRITSLLFDISNDYCKTKITSRQTHLNVWHKGINCAYTINKYARLHFVQNDLDRSNKMFSFNLKGTKFTYVNKEKQLLSRANHLRMISPCEFRDFKMTMLCLVACCWK